MFSFKIDRRQTRMATIAVALVLFFIGCFSTVSVAKAATIEELQAMIATLMAQIVALQAAQASSTNALHIGATITTTDSLRVRSEPGVKALFIATQPSGSTGVIVEGPVVKDGYNWFKVDYATGADGWNVGAWLRARTDLPDVKGVYIGYMNGSQFIKTENISRADALANCKNNATANPTATVSCMWNQTQIYPVLSEVKGVYVGYMNGSQFIKTENISRADALANCKNNATANPTAVVRCTWNQAQIYPIDSTTITLTTPNGGEQWELGVTNTVTWTPYGYNPDVNPAKDVTAYLEIKNSDGTFKTLGKVQESGKASIHWPTGELNSLTAGGNYAPAGNGYYIRVVNNVTGAADRSDQPFTLLSKPVDLKVNNSDGPVAVSLNEMVTLRWSATGVSRCEISNAYRDTSRTTQIGSVPLVGTMSAYLHTDLNWGPTLYCYKNDGSGVYDSVKRISTPGNPSTPATLKIISPNGGEKLDPTKGTTVKYEAQGISSISFALYKNDMWKAWLGRDLNIAAYPSLSTDYIPDMIVAGLGEGDNAGDVFKIYVTGRKADGSGFIDDKSDTAFRFVRSSTTVVTDKAPGKNSFGCGRTFTGTTLANGVVGCYGMWDYGEAFGGDRYMCGQYAEGKIGCQIKTKVCTSGYAKATAYYAASDLTVKNFNVITISDRLNTTTEIVTKDIAGLWEYSCTPAPIPVTPVASSSVVSAVLGASTSVYSEILSTLAGIQATLNGLK